MRFHITAAFLVEILLPKGESRAAVRSRHGGNKQNRRNRRFLSSESSSKSSQAFSEEVGNAASLSDLQVKSINKMPATLTTRQQCDPSATAHETGMRELDIGILSCTNDQECVTSQGSALGGVCVPRGGRMLLPLTDAEQFCDDKYGIEEPQCSCAGFESSRTVVCQTECYYETTSFKPGTVAGMYYDDLVYFKACYFSPGGELCIEYYYNATTSTYSTSFSLETVPCSISSPTACSDPGPYDSYDFDCGAVSGTFCYVDRSETTPPLYCPSKFYEDNCGNDAVAADTACDCTMWGTDPMTDPIKTISCGDDSSCIGFDFDYGGGTLSLSDGVCTDDGNKIGKKNTKKGKKRLK